MKRNSCSIASKQVRAIQHGGPTPQMNRTRCSTRLSVAYRGLSYLRRQGHAESRSVRRVARALKASRQHGPWGRRRLRVLRTPTEYHTSPRRKQDPRSSGRIARRIITRQSGSDLPNRAKFNFRNKRSSAKRITAERGTKTVSTACLADSTGNSTGTGARAPIPTHASARPA